MPTPTDVVAILGGGAVGLAALMAARIAGGGADRGARSPRDRLIRRYAFSDIDAAFAASLDGSVVKPVLVMSDND